MRKMYLHFLALSFVLTACNFAQSKKEIESSLLASVEASVEEESERVEESVNQLIKEQQESESIEKQIDEAVEKALSEQSASYAATSQAQVQIIQVPVETTAAPKKQKQKSYASSSSVEAKVEEIRAMYNTTKNGSYSESGGIMYIADGRMIRAILDIKNRSSNSYPYSSDIQEVLRCCVKWRSMGS